MVIYAIGRSGYKVVIKTPSFFTITPTTVGIENMSGRSQMIMGLCTQGRENQNRR
jgi:hypothetical protein